MAKTITINHEGKEYTLEFTRKSIEIMERQGFIVREIEDKPMTSLPILVAGAFLAHHPKVEKEVVDTIFSKITNKQGFVKKLAEMYSEPIEALMDEPEDSEGNLTWGASW